MVLDVAFHRAFTRPGEPVPLSVTLRATQESLSALQLHLRTTHLTQSVQEVRREVSAPELVSGLSLSLNVPPTAPRGYGLDAVLSDSQGNVLAHRSSGFDVLNHWTETPRYGFLSDFAPGRDDERATMGHLLRYHVNALQFYDWMYRHDTLLPPQETYVDPLGRELSLATVRRLIDAAHSHNIAAMPYTAVYAASIPFYEEHPEWALYQADGTPHFFGENFLAYMDPRPGSPWTKHLLAEFDRVLRETAFDGIHLDQYGEPRLAYDAGRQSFALEEPLAALIEATKDLVSARRQEGAVVFNCVRNWPVAEVAPTGQDLVYIEVWEPYVTFADLHRLVVQAQQVGGGKPVVLAAYIDPAWEHNMRLMDAIIFASGGGRIELGEQGKVLADPYFPNHKPMTPEVAEAMRRLYDFAVRYQDVIGPRSHHEGQAQVTVAEADSGPQPGSVWPIVRCGEGFTAISLVNLCQVTHGRWDREVGAPDTLRHVQVSVQGIGGVQQVWWASPDGDSLEAQTVEATVHDGVDGQRLTFALPSLSYWDLVVVETGA